ncbi:MAG: hypothetical protein LUH58_03510, partial [Lachnospiraceae bacterium]|nr:hypothetical protein [Lachnospiraceae bacterium]
MKNTNLYPFERNRYYSGKMLTSSDFWAEQTYFNNKRRFINNLMYGAGIICGCGVFSLDDLSILVESGAAIDGLGREIVVESSVVKKLSAIEGFESLKSDEVCLCLRYREDPVHTVYTPNKGDKEGEQDFEYNRISESYDLFLMDKEDDAPEYAMESEFFTSMVLLENKDFTVRLTMPATVCRGRNVKLDLTVEKNSAENKKLTYRGILQTPVFLAPDGSHELKIGVKEVSLAEGESVTREYWLHTQNAPVQESSIVMESGAARAAINGEEMEALSGCALTVALTDMRPQDLVSQEIGHISLEMKSLGGAKDYVCLADLKLTRTQNAYIIEEIQEKGVRSYIQAPAQDGLRNRYLEYFTKEADIYKPTAAGAARSKAADQSGWQGRAIEAASGVLEIPLGENARRGD